VEHACIFAELHAQAAYMNVDGPLGFDAVKRGVIPRTLEKLRAVECASGVASERGE
jgi:hypothetical protein